MFESIGVAPGVARLRAQPCTRGGLSADALAALRRQSVGPRPPARVRLAELLAEDPCAEVLAELAELDAGALDQHERVLALQLWERHAGWAAARTQQAIVDVAGPAPKTDDNSTRKADDWAALEVAAALRLSPGSAARRISVARELTGRLTATLRSLECGAISIWSALCTVDAVTNLTDAQTHAVQARVLDGAEQLTAGAFRARLRRAVIAADPAGADDRHTRARQDRRVVLTPDLDGMAWLSQYLTAPEASAAYRRIDELAHAAQAAQAADARQPGGREQLLPAGLTPIDALRADAFLQLTTGTAPASPAGVADSDTGGAGDTTRPPRGTARTEVRVTMDLPTALRLADNPAHLDGYGPIPPELARQLAADASWRRMLIDPVTGHLLDYGRSTYRPPKALADYVRARDVTCRFPGCCRTAMRCDLDHANPYDCEGGTCSANLGALCRHHHRAKTHAGWHLESKPDGAAMFTSPSGHRYRRPAVNHAPEHTAQLNARRERADEDNDPDPPDPWNPDSQQHWQDGRDPPPF